MHSNLVQTGREGTTAGYPKTTNNPTVLYNYILVDIRSRMQFSTRATMAVCDLVAMRRPPLENISRPGEIMPFHN